jgi:hypothetical protein
MDSFVIINKELHALQWFLLRGCSWQVQKNCGVFHFFWPGRGESSHTEPVLYEIGPPVCLTQSLDSALSRNLEEHSLWRDVGTHVWHSGLGWLNLRKLSSDLL